MVIATVEDVRHRLFLFRITVALDDVVLSPEDLIRHVELALLLLSKEVAAGWAEDAEDGVANVVAAKYSGEGMQSNDGQGGRALLLIPLHCLQCQLCRSVDIVQFLLAFQ